MKRSFSRPASRFHTRFSSIERLEERIAFDGTGIVTTDIDNGSSDYARDVEIQADGKIIAVGYSTTTAKKSYTDFALARYNADGGLDTTFSGDGKVFTRTSINDIARAITIQSDSKLVVAGQAATKGNNTGYNAFAITRYKEDGSLDMSFDGDGQVVTDLGSWSGAHAVKIQSDQRIIAGGWANLAFGLVRYNANGSLDTSFGGTGKVRTDLVGVVSLAQQHGVEDLAIQSDGKIIAGGGGLHLGYFMLARYNADGTLDTGFGEGGKVLHYLGGDAMVFKLLLQPDGKILAAGWDGFVARYNSDGSLDTSFGNAGVVQRPDSIRGLGFQSDGRIVLTSQRGFVAARLNPDGSLDPTFGSGGSTRVFPTDSPAAYSLRVEPDDKIVLVGDTGTPADFISVRLTKDGVLDTAWGAGASASTSTLSAAIQTSETTALAGQDSVSVARIDAASIDQLLSSAESTWTRKSRVKVLV